jgi:hypothetical protein
MTGLNRGRLTIAIELMVAGGVRMPSPPLTTVAEKVVGTWKLRTVVYEDQETKERSPVYGAHPIGYQWRRRAAAGLP